MRQRHVRISAACEACKKRKTRCTGGPPPCQLCQSLGTECVIDLSLDMRRRAALQRAIDESQSSQRVLHFLVDNIRRGPSSHLDSLFDYIRGATISNVASAIENYMVKAEEEVADKKMSDNSHSQSTQMVNGTTSGQKHDEQSFSNKPVPLEHPRRHEVVCPDQSIRVDRGAQQSLPKGEGETRRFEGGLSKDMSQQTFSPPISISTPYQSVDVDVTTTVSVDSSPTVPSFEPNSVGAMAQTIPPYDLIIAQTDQPGRIRIPRHLVLPLIAADNSPISRTYTDYVQGARSMLDSGVPASDIIGTDDRIRVDRLFRAREPSDKFDCATWACEVWWSYRDFDVFVRLGAVVLSTYMMRWLLVPTPENYSKLPDMMKPTPLQCMIPHIGAIEIIPMPPVRDAVISKLRDWLTPLNQGGWSVNWPYGMNAAIEHDSGMGAMVLTQEFIVHVADYNNWSVGSSFLAAFPDVAARIKIHDHQRPEIYGKNTGTA